MKKYNRKGMIPSALVDFSGYLAFVVVIIVFLFLFKLPAAKTNIIKTIDFSELTEQQVLVNYLKTPTDFKGKTITMAEYITMMVGDKSVISSGKRVTKYPLIKERLDDYINGFNGCYVLEIKHPPGVTIVELSTIVELRGGTLRCASLSVLGFKPVQVPLQNGESLNIKLLVEQDDKSK